MKKAKVFRNIGPVSEKWLNSVGIFTLEDLKKVGSKKAFEMIKAKGLNTNRVLIYALEGAIHDKHWVEVAQYLKNKS